MWDSYPESVTLIKKNREIVAVNKAGRRLGREIGMKCSNLEPLSNHKNCQADTALKNHEYAYRKKTGPLGDVISFWLPLAGYPDYLIHFSVGSALKYEYTDK